MYKKNLKYEIFFDVYFIKIFYIYNTINNIVSMTEIYRILNESIVSININENYIYRLEYFNRKLLF